MFNRSLLPCRGSAVQAAACGRAVPDCGTHMNIQWFPNVSPWVPSALMPWGHTHSRRHVLRQLRIIFWSIVRCGRKKVHIRYLISWWVLVIQSKTWYLLYYSSEDGKLDSGVVCSLFPSPRITVAVVVNITVRGRIWSQDLLHHSHAFYKTSSLRNIAMCICMWCSKCMHLDANAWFAIFCRSVDFVVSSNEWCENGDWWTTAVSRHWSHVLSHWEWDSLPPAHWQR